jgi:hypothetical protein
MMIGRPLCIGLRKASPLATSSQLALIGYYDRTCGPSPPAYQPGTCTAFNAGHGFWDGERKVRASRGN